MCFNGFGIVENRGRLSDSLKSVKHKTTLLRLQSNFKTFSIPNKTESKFIPRPRANPFLNIESIVLHNTFHHF